MLVQNILINLRTYDTHSLILYANDHLNNFVHLYISNGTSIVYLFNAGNEIKNITVQHPGGWPLFFRNSLRQNSVPSWTVYKFPKRYRSSNGEPKTNRDLFDSDETNIARKIDFRNFSTRNVEIDISSVNIISPWEEPKQVFQQFLQKLFELWKKATNSWICKVFIVVFCRFFCRVGVNTGISVQIAIVRSEKSTTLHVNENNVTLDAVPLLLDSYSNKPWINPEKEVLAPQRPPAPPTDYFQVCNDFPIQQKRKAIVKNWKKNDSEDIHRSERSQ